MYLTLVDAKKRGVRATYLLTKDADKCYPKRPERALPVTLDGATVEIRVTGSENYAVKSEAGNNGWIRLDGKTYWFLFDAGFDPRAKPLVFALSEGTAPDKNPVRAPKNAAGEAARRVALSASLKAKYGTAEVEATEPEVKSEV
jgi:hypothetical protein